jgi:hypothetical protein
MCVARFIENDKASNTNMRSKYSLLSSEFLAKQATHADIPLQKNAFSNRRM